MTGETLSLSVVGEPPAFVSQQEDVVVSAEVLVHVPGGDNSANLVLQCQVTGTPTPTIAWFRDGGSLVGAEFVNSDGTLAMNITEPEQATASGTTYYCLATNSIGLSLPAIARSRDVTVTLTCELPVRESEFRGLSCILTFLLSFCSFQWL